MLCNIQFIWVFILFVGISISCFQDCSQRQDFPRHDPSDVDDSYTFESVKIIKYNFQYDSCDTHEDEVYMSNEFVVTTWPIRFHAIAKVEGYRAHCVPANAKYMNDNYWIELPDIIVPLNESDEQRQFKENIVHSYQLIWNGLLQKAYLTKSPQNLDDYAKILNNYEQAGGLDNIFYYAKGNDLDMIYCKQMNVTSIIRNNGNDKICYNYTRVMVGNEMWFSEDGINLFKEAAVIPCPVKNSNFSIIHFSTAFSVFTIIGIVWLLYKLNLVKIKNKHGRYTRPVLFSNINFEF